MNVDRVWVTGAHGFIGRHLSRAVAGEGRTIAGLGHGAWPAAERSISGVDHWLDGAISSSHLDSLGDRCGAPELVFHLAGGSSVGAAIASPHEDFSRTVESTATLLDWLRRRAPAARLVVASSAAVYGGGHAGAIAETAALAPYSPYGHHKAMMESLCISYGATYGVRSVRVRLFSVYGAGLQKQLLWDLCSKLASGPGSPELGGTGDEMRDWTDVRDVVRALLLAAEFADASAPAINAGSGVGTSVRSVARAVAAAWQPDDPGRPIGFSGRSRPGDPFSLIADPSQLAARGFVWRVPLEPGIADYVRWFRQHHGPLR